MGGESCKKRNYIEKQMKAMEKRGMTGKNIYMPSKEDK